MIFNNVGILGMGYVEGPIVVTSESLENKIGDVLEKFGMRRNIITSLTGIKERRFWDRDTKPSDIATQAAMRALENANIPKEKIGILVNASVCRDYVEPSTACIVHGNLNLSPNCINFDVSNACMGFLNAIQTVGSMIEAGSIEYGLIVTGEITWEYIDKLDYIKNNPNITEKEVRDYFAGFTLGCGAVAMVLTKSDKYNDLPQIKSNYTMTDTYEDHNKLCTADHEKIVTDSSALTHFGILLGQSAFEKIKKETDFDKKQIDHIIVHQMSDVQINKFVSIVGLDVSKTINTLEYFGNTASAAIPFTLAKASDDNKFQKGDRILLLGFGSGINFNMMEVVW